MSVAGIFSSSLLNFNTQSIQNQGIQSQKQQFQTEFQQLGQDLQSGNLSAAQADFATLQQLRPQTNSTSSSQSNSPIAQEFNQLSQDLQSGNISAAQQDYAKIQQDLQNQVQGHHHHHHHGGGAGEANSLSQELSVLGQALQAGSLSSAQQAYSALQQDFPQLVQNNALLTPALPQSGSNSVSVNA